MKSISVYDLYSLAEWDITYITEILKKNASSQKANYKDFCKKYPKYKLLTDILN